MRDNITKYSNPKQAQKQAYKYLGKKNGKLYRSTRKEKKYMVKDPKTNNWVHHCTICRSYFFINDLRGRVYS